MLSRSKTVLRLIELRKSLYEIENSPDRENNEWYDEIKDKVDKLLIDVIGVPEKGHSQINNILEKAIKDEIKTRTAVVAIYEKYNDFCESNQLYSQENNVSDINNSSKTKREEKSDRKKSSNFQKELEHLYESGYR